MTLIRHYIFAFLLLLAAPAFAGGDASWFYRGSDIPADPAWTFGTLPNGMHYAVRRNALPAGQVSIRLRIAAGALHETDSEQGWAHFVEHMTFRGTRSFADREMRQLWQTLGASFGSDTNATTQATQTVYQLDLPKADRASLDASLKAIAEMADSARFDPALVEAERKVVLAEKGRQPELTTRLIETSYPLFYAGLKQAVRNTIGTDATLAAATHDGLRAFYERWYRPERATLVVVGDADPAMIEELIAAQFGGWRGEGSAPAEPDYGKIADNERFAAIAYPGAPHSATLAWLRPYVDEPNTMARERADLATALGARILNRRLEAKARGDASFLTAGVAQGRSTNVADMTQLSITAKEGRWRNALIEVFAVINAATQRPPTDTEIARELSNLRTAALAGVESEATIRSQQRAQQLINAIDDNSVLATATASLAMVDEFTPAMTPAVIHEATEQLFTGAGPRLMLLTPDAVARNAVAAALDAAQAAAPAVSAAERIVSLDDLPPLGPPGREVSRQQIEDLGVTIVRFANGATLTFKQTDFDKGSVLTQLRFGAGLVGIDPARDSLAWTSGVIGPSGLAGLDLDAMERLMTGRRIGFSFAIDQDAFTLRGLTSGHELQDQLRLLATKLAYPRWDQQLFGRLQAGALGAYELSFSSAAARANREFGGFLRGGDERWAPVERREVAAARLPAVRRFFDPLLGAGPIEAIIVGDVDLETAIKAAAATIGALPARRAPALAARQTAVRPPQPNPAPTVFTHRGDANQAYAAIGWNTFGGTGRLRERRALSVAANLMQVRLFDRLREEEGATYSPSANSQGAEDFPDWGIFFATAEIRPESADTFFRIAREVVADLAATPVGADEFARAQNPIVSGIERRVKTNGYWLDVLEGWVKRPELIDAARSYRDDYVGLTPEDVRRAVAAHVADGGDWSMLVLPARAEAGGK